MGEERGIQIELSMVRFMLEIASFLPLFQSQLLPKYTSTKKVDPDTFITSPSDTISQMQRTAWLGRLAKNFGEKKQALPSNAATTPDY
jgi:hypothetical protein